MNINHKVPYLSATSVSIAINPDFENRLLSVMGQDSRREYLKRKNKLRMCERARVERESEVVSQLLSKEDIMRFSYVPFVVASLAWDYADTIMNMAAMMRLVETKPLCRTVRQLRNDYDHVRAPYENHKQGANSMESNMLVFESAVQDTIKLLLLNLDTDLKKEYPLLDEEYVWLLRAVYECHVVLQCVYLYCRIWRKKVEEIVRHPIGDILPPQLRKLGRLVLEFVGDKPVSNKFEKQLEVYAKILCNRMMDIELIDNSND